MSKYIFEIWNDEGELLLDLAGRAHNRSFTVSKNLPEQITFTLGVKQIEELAREINIPIRELINAGVNEVRIRRDDNYLVGGKIEVAEVTIDGDQQNITIRASGFLNLFDDRYAGEDTARVFTATDAGTIAKTLIDETQAETNGDFGVDTHTDWVEATVNRDKSYERKTIKEAIMELSALSGGFDFEFTYDKKFKVYNQIGQNRTDLVFDYPGNIRNLTLPIDSTRLGNRFLVRGAGFGANQYKATVQDTVSQGTYKIRTRIVDEPSETMTANLTAKGEEERRVYALPLEIPSVVLDGATAPRVGIDFWMGDSIKLSIKSIDVLETLTTIWRVEEIRVDIDDDGAEVISLKLAK